jgi:hypothetical protein
MKKFLFLTGVLALCIPSAGCSVSSEPAGSDCDSVSCADALSGGLSASGRAICDSASDSAYGDLQSCACGDGSGPCDDVCSGNLCADLGAASDCGDCLSANCSSEQDTCANN